METYTAHVVPMNEEWEIPKSLVKSYIDYLETHAGDKRFFYGNVYLDWYYRLPVELRDNIQKRSLSKSRSVLIG